MKHGLRWIANRYQPSWMSQTLTKQTERLIILYQLLINQISCVVYFNDTDKIMWNSNLEMHWEGRKFSFVDMLSFSSGHLILMMTLLLSSHAISSCDQPLLPG